MIQKLGPYRIERIVGRGGMGAVYAGTDETTGRRAALKVLAPSLATDESFRERFTAEIESLKKLQHPNIVELYGYGQEGDLVFYAMELIEGPSLQEELTAGRRFSWREVAEIGVQVSAALKHAHNHGVIHRDLKPANLLLAADQQIKLGDFGIAKLFGQSALTADGGVLGTADYMAPEQADGRSVTARCDLYSLGSVLYALLAGRPPFVGKSLPEVIHKVRYDEPLPIRRFVPDVPVQFEQLISELLEKDPAQRVPTALAVSNRLLAIVRALTIQPTSSEQVALDADRAQDDAGSSSAGEKDVSPGVVLETEVRSPARDFASCPMSAPEATAAMPGMPLTPASVLRGARSDSDSRVVPAASPIRPADAVPALAPSAAAPVSRFVIVDETVRQREALAVPDEPIWTKWMWGLLALTFLLVLGFVSLQFLRPPTADQLYDQIRAAAEVENGPWIDQDALIQQFRRNFPQDPRLAEMDRYQEELELNRLRNRFERNARRFPGELTALEQSYVEAMRRRPINREETADRLQAILDVYQDQPHPSTETRRCLTLVKRQLQQLQTEIQEATQRYAKVLRERLAHADHIASTNPQSAQAIWRGIVRLYADKPWAASAVGEAERRLKTPTPPENSR